ncbi:FAD-dependent oxidoreductase [Rhizocola hellebori]|uniref:FAD-dependent oxidoreductase n=1 Tax=Rhizocola hellebori TaxID=1392758 RepID=A0A8J3QCE8_9ACTN|nr:FAD-dependent oxidoreductase [Rhizocola hellebori]GIH07133.1 FAD-dependent oxidoreductase [Rhizocola hellebori]
MARSAAIIGGGIGGLATAAALATTGWQVEVFERAPRLPDTGTGLGIWPNALRALDRLGLGEAARSLGRKQPSGAITRPDGSRIATIDTARVERRLGEPVYLLSRPALLRLLATAVPEGAVRYGHPIDDPPRSGYDLIVGADGIHSTTRKAVFGDRPGLVYSGWTVWRGTVQLDLEVGGETWGRAMKFGVTPQEPGRTNWYAVRTAPEGYRPPGGDLAELRQLFGHWHDPVPRILDRIELDGFLRHDLHYLPALAAFVTGNVALIGDAAHAMTPDLGQGACQAMIDGVALADALAADRDVPTALRHYDRARRKPAQRLAAMSLRASQLARMSRLLPLRDALTRAALAFGPPG